MPLQILVLGGTVFLGRHLVDTLVARGHEVTTFHRGQHPDVHPGVRSLRGDRDGGLQALAESSMRWDAVIDTSGYLPRVVRQSAALLAGRAGRYVFVSSISAYADLSMPGLDESAALAAPPSPTADDAEDVMKHYGGLKAGCEREVVELFGPARSLVVRPGLIVGPHDPTGRFTYWAKRFAQGGRILVPGPQDRPVQWMDARDLAAWIADAVEAGRYGAFHLAGPVGGCDFGRFVQAGLAGCPQGGEPVWVDSAFLRAQGVPPWTGLPLWLDDEAPGMLDLDIGAATRTGLVTRPLTQTFADTRRWAEEAGEADGRDRAGLTPQRERELLAAWDAR